MCAYLRAAVVPCGRSCNVVTVQLSSMSRLWWLPSTSEFAQCAVVVLALEWEIPMRHGCALRWSPRSSGSAAPLFVLVARSPAPCPVVPGVLVTRPAEIRLVTGWICPELQQRGCWRSHWPP